MLLSSDQGLIHEIRITNQVMYLAPPIEEARFQLMQQLFAWQRIITGLKRLESSRYQVGIEQHESNKTAVYRTLLSKLPDGKQVLEEPYDAIEKILKQVQEYVKVSRSCLVWHRFMNLS